MVFWLIVRIRWIVMWTEVVLLMCSKGVVVLRLIMVIKSVFCSVKKIRIV